MDLVTYAHGDYLNDVDTIVKTYPQDLMGAKTNLMKNPDILETIIKEKGSQRYSEFLLLSFLEATLLHAVYKYDNKNYQNYIEVVKAPIWFQVCIADKVPPKRFLTMKEAWSEADSETIHLGLNTIFSQWKEVYSTIFQKSAANKVLSGLRRDHAFDNLWAQQEFHLSDISGPIIKVLAA